MSEDVGANEVTYRNWERNWRLIFNDHICCDYCGMILLPAITGRVLAAEHVSILVRAHGFYCTMKPEYLADWK